MQVDLTDPVASTPARVAEKVRAAAYGTVLVIAALGVTKVNDVAAGYAAELVLRGCGDVDRPPLRRAAGPTCGRS